MPINFDLEKIRKEYDCLNYFETGLYDCVKFNVSSHTALKCNFNNVYCIEIDKKWIDMGNNVFQKEIKEGRYNLYHDDSSNMGKYLNNKTFEDKTLFFLDAHDITGKLGAKQNCPLYDELNAIDCLNRKDNIILIDDLRVIKDKGGRDEFWNDKSYGNIDHFNTLKNRILKINSNYKFKYLNGVCKDDVLLCYI